MSKNFQKFKKKIGTIVVTAGMLIATTMTVNADTLNITNHVVNFRENASKKSDIINTLPKGTEVSVLGTEKNWVKVGYNGQTGYIYKTHLDTITKKIGTVKVGNSRLNVRNKSSMSGKIIGKLYTGNKVEIKGENGNWYKINADFATEINNSFNSLPLSNIEFVECPSDKDEDDYNQLLVDNIPDAHLIHKYKISIGGGSGNNIEPCDVAIDKTCVLHLLNIALP